MNFRWRKVRGLKDRFPFNSFFALPTSSCSAYLSHKKKLISVPPKHQRVFLIK